MSLPYTRFISSNVTTINHEKHGKRGINLQANFILFDGQVWGFVVDS
jgi:hypothetical protein